MEDKDQRRRMPRGAWLTRWAGTEWAFESWERRSDAVMGTVSETVTLMEVVLTTDDHPPGYRAAVLKCHPSLIPGLVLPE